MGYITKRSDGSLHRNDEKKADNHPDMTGKVEVTKDILDLMNRMMQESPDGKIRPKLAAWHRRSKSDNKPYFYVRLEAYMQEGESQNNSGYTPPVQNESFEDDIPF